RTLAEVRPEVQWPHALQSVLDRALARQPQERYARSVDFAADLARVLAGAPGIDNALHANGSAEATAAPLPPTRVRGGSGGAPPSASGATTVVRPAATSTPPLPLNTRDAELFGAPPRVRNRRLATAAGAVVLAGAVFAVSRAISSPDVKSPAPSALDSMIAQAEQPSAPRDSASAARKHATGTQRFAKGLRPDSPITKVAQPASTVALPTDTAAKSDALEPADSALVAPKVGPLGRERQSSQPFSMVESRNYLTVAGKQIENAVSRDNRRRLQALAAVLYSNLGRFTTRADSAEALYHIGEALIAHGNLPRGCDLMRRLQTDPKWANGAAYLVRTQCQ
ncbi:MAG: hypothetical protein ABJD07_07100, partial [Gemmatimonadaceae bacterium]